MRWPVAGAPKMRPVGRASFDSLHSSEQRVPR